MDLKIAAKNAIAFLAAISSYLALEINSTDGPDFGRVKPPLPPPDNYSYKCDRIYRSNFCCYGFGYILLATFAASPHLRS